MRTISFTTGVTVIALMSAAVIGTVFIFSTFIEETVHSDSSPDVTFFDVSGALFQARISDGVARVDVWEMATSTKPNDNQLIGSMKEQDGTWVLPVPSNPRVVNTYVARAYDSSGALIDTRSLPVSGKNKVYTYLWGPTDDNNQSVSIGERIRYNDMVFTVNEVNRDSRCPSDVQCIVEGSVVFDYTLTSPRGTFKGTGNTASVIEVDRYILRTVDVLPLRDENVTSIHGSQYRFLFEIHINTETLSIGGRN